MAGFTDDLINKVGDFGPEMLRQLDQAKLTSKGFQAIVSINLAIGTSAGEGFADLLEQCLKNCDENEDF